MTSYHFFAQVEKILRNQNRKKGPLMMFCVLLWIPFEVLLGNREARSVNHPNEGQKMPEMKEGNEDVK